jgi:hypothetical protein
VLVLALRISFPRTNLVLTLECPSCRGKSNCYNDAGWAHKRREENAALPPSRNARPLATSFKASGSATKGILLEHW